MPASHAVLITIDSLRHDGVAGPGGDDQSPQISLLADQGAEFTQAIANGPNTPSSFPTILTGTYPLLYGGYRYLDERRPFLAATLNGSGYRTVGYHSNPHLGPEKNYNEGFERFNDGTEDADNTNSLKNFVDRHVPADSLLYSFLRRVWHLMSATTDTSAYAKAPTISDRAIDWLTGDWNGEDNFFMWLHYMDVHYPFMPPDEHVRAVGGDPFSNRRVADLNGRMQEDPETLSEADVADLETLYDGEIHFTDHHVGRVLDAIEELDALDETLVAITADHGEGFGEHGQFGHHPDLYDELLRVPLVLNGPEIPDVTLDEQVSLVNLPSTIYESLDVETPAEDQGQPLQALLAGEESEERVALVTSRGGDHLACRTRKWKCFWQVDTDTVELYDLTTDPGENEEVSADNPEVVGRFMPRLRDHLADSVTTDVETPEIEEDEAVKQRLRDLGYTE
jgi:arylsulfatase A-like enzyme